MTDVNEHAKEHIGTAARAVGERDVEGRPAKAVVLARTYPTAIDDLWDAVTSAERIPRWLLPISGDLRLGGRYQLEGNAGGTITACDPPHGFDATWEFGGALSWIEARLTALDGDHTRLEVTHLAHPDEHWEQFGPGAAGTGWDAILLGLALHLVTGGDLPVDAATWPATAEGMQFFTASGRAWKEADIAGGEDPQIARAAAERTIAAYTQPTADA
jgi:uncharacterized protein YndB with AHSA1/START domain